MPALVAGREAAGDGSREAELPSSREDPRDASVPPLDAIRNTA